MKRILFTYILISYSTLLFSNENSWIPFWNESNTLMGFKDSKGNIKIEPRFMGLATPGTFDNIIVVTEKKGENYISYYLTKSGKKIYKDIYVYDNGPDVESEGFIRFKDKEKDAVGMLDKDGNVVIPPEYNDLLQVQNGFVVALKGAKKVYWDKHKESGCNHYSWIDGTEYLIDTRNKILVDNFKYESTYNFFTVKKQTSPDKNPDRINFEAVDGQYVSILDFRKEFENFINNVLLTDLSLEKILSYSPINMSYRNKNSETVVTSKYNLIGNNYEILKNRLLELTNEDTNYHISYLNFNPLLFDELNLPLNSFN